jgi:branched-chain amino acid aminotransferase
MAARSSKPRAFRTAAFLGRDARFRDPWTVDEIEAAKYEVLANGLSDAYVRAVAWRGAGEDMGVSSARNPVRLAIAAWEWGAYYGDAKFKGAKLDISKWKRPSPETIPVPRQGGRSLHDLHHVQARRRGQGLLRRADVRLSRLRGRGDRAPTSSSSRTARCTRPKPDCFLNGITRQTVIGMLKDRRSRCTSATSCPRSWKASSSAG